MSRAMEEYAEAKKKKGKPEVVGVTVRKAKNGFIVSTDSDDYSSRASQTVYPDIAGVLKCVKEKLGGS